MRGLIRTAVAFGAVGLVGIGIIARWPITEPVHLGMLTGDAFRAAYLARSSGCIACHTNAATGGASLAGGAPLDTPFGRTSPLIPKAGLANGRWISWPWPCGKGCDQMAKPIILAIQTVPLGLCWTNPVRDSSRESSVIAWVDEQTEHTDLQDPEMARV